MIRTVGFIVSSLQFLQKCEQILVDFRMPEEDAILEFGESCAELVARSTLNRIQELSAINVTPYMSMSKLSKIFTAQKLRKA